MDEARFTQLTPFLRWPHWEATSNGAERVARLFRHWQAPHYALRWERPLEDAGKRRALATRAEATGERRQRPACCVRGGEKDTRRGSIVTQAVRAA